MKKILFLILSFIIFSSPALCKKKDEAFLPENKGYVGTLPNLSEKFQKTSQELSAPSFEYEDGFNDPDKIKPAPRNNPAFINIIMKQEKSSQYLNDLQDIISILEKLETLIEEQQNVQKFNALAYFLEENVEYFRDKYKNKAESSYISFKEVMKLNNQVQAIAKLRTESEIYSPFVTVAQSGNVFSQNSINNQLEYLNSTLKQTLIVLKETK